MRTLLHPITSHHRSCATSLNSCPSRGLRTKSRPPPGLPFPGCVRNSGSRPRTTLHPNRAVMVTNAQQTPALRNRNLTCSTRARGQLSSRGSAPPSLPGSPRVPLLGSLGLQPQHQLKLLQRSCPHVQLVFHLLLALSVSAPTLPTAAKSCWVLHLMLPGSCLGLSAEPDTCFGGELQGKLRMRLYLHQHLTTLLCVAVFIPLPLKQRVYSSSPPSAGGITPWILAGLQRLKFPLHSQALSALTLCALEPAFTLYEEQEECVIRRVLLVPPAPCSSQALWPCLSSSRTNQREEKHLKRSAWTLAAGEHPHLSFPLWTVPSRMSLPPWLRLGCKRAALEGPQGWLGE